MNSEEIEKLYRGSIKELYTLYSKASKDDILNWMNSRPSAEMKFVEVEGDKEIVVVIPTANAFGEFASHVKKLYKGLQIIFVESNGPLFNYARSVNAGIKEAIKYKPRWIVISNDDIIRIESIEKLKDELSTVSNVELVMASKSDYHTYNVLIINPKDWFIKGMRAFGKIANLAPAKVYGEILKYRGKLGVKYITIIQKMVPFSKYIGKGIVTLNCGSFAIVKPKENLMDPTFINSHEDLLLSLSYKHEIINFKLKEKKGASLGFGELRFAKIFVNEIYFNYLIEKNRIRLDDLVIGD
ncbi:glycosyltransferase family 2 protein [Acidianus manzaensis]|uniref:Glycosyl transferase family 2 n=1 Tax=Acidianus manzaensis TaxID=282676 RepID=A0A1W6JZA2_9CREN|nr:hypothetical protein [Acidianus manzaensis]ARM75588.1 hypothetical protein B6F84_05745 [Acidianus manzaensis]